MSRLWSIVSFLAVVHLLALTLFLGWLYQSGRLSRGRIDQVRSMFALTTDEQAAAEEESQRMQDEESAAQSEQYRVDNPSPGSAIQVAHLTRLQERTDEQRRRFETETDQLRQRLRADQGDLVRERTAFQAEQTAWAQEQQRRADQSTDTQFKSVVALLEKIPAKQAKDLLVEWINEGDLNEAAIYLNAMDPQAAPKVLREFKKENEPQLAKQLLERMRVIGQTTGFTQDAPDDDSPTGSP